MPDLDTPDTDRRPDTDAERIIVALPSLGADMDVGTVIQWCVDIGDRVERGDIVAVVATEKSDIDVETWDSGIVSELIAPTDEEIEVGRPLLALTVERPTPTGIPSATGQKRSEEQPLPTPTETATEEPPPEPAAGQRVTPDQHRPEQPTAEPPARIRASPLARRLAAERGIPLTGVAGSGPRGAVLADDVDTLPASSTAPAPGRAPSPAAADQPSPAQPTSPTESQTDKMRRAIAERMTRSNRDIPHYHLERDIDMTASLDWLAAHNDDLPITERVVPASLLACAVARAARDVPSLNGSWPEDHFVPAASVDLGIVVSLRTGGLVTPTVTDADGLDPDEMMAAMREMVTAARKGQLRSRWMAPASITITNLGDNGADRVAGIIFPPQVALLGFGRITDRPVIIDGVVASRKVVTATLSGDHRATDGAEGSRFLAAVAKVLEHPATSSG